MSRGRMLAATLVVMPVVLQACRCTPSSSGPRDAQDDSGVDGATDAVSVDADSWAPDTTVEPDSGSPDLGRSEVFGEGWYPFPGIDKCSGYIAKAPSTMVAPLKWKACDSGRLGCRVSIADWAKPGAWSMLTLQPEAVRLVRGKPYLHLQRRWVLDDPGGVMPTGGIDDWEEIDGPVLLALGFDFAVKPVCGVQLQLGDFGAAIFGRSAGYPGALIMESSPWFALGTFASALVPLSAWGATEANTMRIGSTKFFVGLMFTGIGVFDPITAAAVGTGAPAEFPRPTDAGALAGSFKHGITFIRDDASWVDIILSKPGRGVSGLAVDRSSAETIAYVEINTAGLARFPDLWTSPMATTPGAASPKRLTTISSPMDNIGYGLVANRGVALLVTDTAKAMLYRLSDGAGWTIKADTGQTFVEALWVDDDEVWVAVSTRVDGYMTGIMRLRRDTLGTPDVPPS